MSWTKKSSTHPDVTVGQAIEHVQMALDALQEMRHGTDQGYKPAPAALEKVEGFLKDSLLIVAELRGEDFER